MRVHCLYFAFYRFQICTHASHIIAKTPRTTKTTGCAYCTLSKNMQLEPAIWRSPELAASCNSYFCATTTRRGLASRDESSR